MIVDDLLKVMNDFDTLSLWNVYYDEDDYIQWDKLISKSGLKKYQIPVELRCLKIEAIDVTNNHIDIGIEV